MNNNNLLSAIIMIGLVIFFSCLTMCANRCTVGMVQGGTVVDKYRNAWGFPKLSIEEDGEYTSIFVSEEEYYDYEIGEYFTYG